MKYRPDFRGTMEAMNSREMVKFIERRTRAAGRFAKSISPYGSPRNGHYVDRFENSTRPYGGPGLDRAEGTVSNSSEYAPAVERKHRILRRTIRWVESGGSDG